jgi:hypothetical protein
MQKALLEKEAQDQMNIRALTGAAQYMVKFFPSLCLNSFHMNLEPSIRCIAKLL